MTCKCALALIKQGIFLFLQEKETGYNIYKFPLQGRLAANGQNNPLERPTQGWIIF